MGKESTDAELEWNSNGIGSQTGATEGDHVLYPSSGLWPGRVSSPVCRKGYSHAVRVVMIRTNLHKSPSFSSHYENA